MVMAFTFTLTFALLPFAAAGATLLAAGVAAAALHFAAIQRPLQFGPQ